MNENMDWDLEQQAIDEMAENEVVMDLCRSLLDQLDKELGVE